MDKTDIISRLQTKEILGLKNIRFRPLKGGVSSDIFVASDGENKVVVKQALNKLKVADEWFADPARNRIEQVFIQHVKTFLPGFVPDVLYTDKEDNFFVMEFLGPSFSSWKEQLLNGIYDPRIAGKTAGYLADLHIQTSDDPQAETRFRSNEHFISLRIEPYLITTGDRHPQLRKIYKDESERLKQKRQALIHGDFSPKNIMVSRDRVVLLDHEVACYGDPAFDVAFLLNHLFLKNLYHTGKTDQLPALVPLFWQTYYKKWPSHKMPPPEPETVRLLLLLMLARVDGKSPVEYLVEKQQKFVRSFVYDMLHKKNFQLNEIHRAWNDEIKKQFNEN
ncbi:MAG: phosphotransferase [Balneolaceae bacterium]